MGFSIIFSVYLSHCHGLKSSTALYNSYNFISAKCLQCSYPGNGMLLYFSVNRIIARFVCVRSSSSLWVYLFTACFFFFSYFRAVPLGTVWLWASSGRLHTSVRAGAVQQSRQESACCQPTTTGASFEQGEGTLHQHVSENGWQGWFVMGSGCLVCLWKLYSAVV